MAMSRDRIDSSVPALVKRGFIGLMQIGEIDGLVIAWREVNVAQHLSAVGTFALDANCEGGTLSLPTQDSAKTKRRIDLVSGYRHPCRIRPITRARRVFRVSANNREVVFSEHLCCERRERYNAQHSGRNHLFSPSHCTLLPRGHCIVLLQSEAVAFGKPSSSIYFQVAPHGGIRPAARRRSISYPVRKTVTSRFWSNVIRAT